MPRERQRSTAADDAAERIAKVREAARFGLNPSGLRRDVDTRGRERDSHRDAGHEIRARMAF